MRHGLTTLNISSIHRNNPIYPVSLQSYLGEHAPEKIFALDEVSILQKKMIAFFCSVKCPGNLIIRTYDLMRNLRDSGVVVVSGFHSPMEKECLSILLRGNQPVVWCLAKGLTTGRLPKKYSKPISDGRLLMLSTFGDRIKRVTEDTAQIRNDFIAGLADKIFVAYASQGSKTESFCRKIIEWNKPLFTFDSPENRALLAMGAREYIILAKLS